MGRGFVGLLALVTSLGPTLVDTAHGRWPLHGKVRIPVLGVASIDGAERKQVVTWSYELNGERVETKVPPPGLRMTRMTSNVARIMVLVPTQIVGIRIGSDLQQFFEKPVEVGTDQKVRCTCTMRDDCVAGNTFQCEIEGYVDVDKGKASGSGG